MSTGGNVEWGESHRLQAGICYGTQGVLDKTEATARDSSDVSTSNKNLVHGPSIFGGYQGITKKGLTLKGYFGFSHSLIKNLPDRYSFKPIFGVGIGYLF